MSEPASSPAAEEVVQGAETAVAPGATEGQPGTQTPPVSPPPPPPPPQRNPWLSQMARNAGVSQDTIDATATDEELQRLVTFAASRPQPQQAPVQQTGQVQAPPAPPEVTYNLPPEIAAELEDISPAVHKAFQHVGKEAVRAQAEAKAAKEELDRVNRQRQLEQFEGSVHEIMNGYEILGKKRPTQGSPEDFRRRALLSQLSELDRTGQLRGLSAEQAIDMAVKVMFGGSSPPPSPPPPPAPAGGRLPSITAPPTHRRGAEEEEDLVELWRTKIEENDRAYREKEKSAGRNGEFRP